MVLLAQQLRPYLLVSHGILPALSTCVAGGLDFWQGTL